MAAKAERVAHRNIDPGLASLQRYEIHFGIASFIGISQINGGGAVDSLMAFTHTINSTAPLAPSKCQMQLLVEPQKT